jgi:hypothetical protein
MSDDECEEWEAWVDGRPGRIIRMRGTIVRIGRPCVACGHVVPERDEPPYADHAESCTLALGWRALADGRGMMREAIERLLAELAAVERPHDCGPDVDPAYHEVREELAARVSQRLEAILAGRDDGPVIPPVWPIVSVPIIPVDPEIDARVEALARRHEPTTGASSPLTRDEVRELLDEGKHIRRAVEERVDRMEKGIK